MAPFPKQILADNAQDKQSPTVQPNQLGTGTNTEILGTLEQNSATLSNISQKFVERGAKLQIRTFL